MSTTRSPFPRAATLRLFLPLFVFSLVAGGTVAGCGGGTDAAMTGADATPAAAAAADPTGAPVAAATQAPVSVVDEPAVPMGAMTMPTADEVSATWAARPEYVSALPAEGQAAYAFALARPDVLQWLPCYCGCGAIPHRSNLDCFFQRREVKGTYEFEQHASFCDICVQTANTASALLRQGQTMTQIRAAIDAQFGGGAAPGTDTPLPPAS